MTVFQSYCITSIHLNSPWEHKLRAYNGPYLLLAGAYLLNSYQIFTQKAFWKGQTVSFKKEIQDSFFVQTRIKYSLLLEKHSSAIEQCASNSLATLPLYSLGNFPEKGRLQKPSSTLSLAARHFWSSFQVSIDMFKHLNLKKKKAIS